MYRPFRSSTNCAKLSVRFLGQPLEGFGLIGALTLRCAGYELGRCDRNFHAWLGLDAVDHDEEPKECKQDELRDAMMRYHTMALPPPTCAEMRALYPVLGSLDSSADLLYAPEARPHRCH